MQTRLDDFFHGSLGKDAIPFTQYIEELDVDEDEDSFQDADLEQDSMSDGEPDAPRRESMYVQMFDGKLIHLCL